MTEQDNAPVDEFETRGPGHKRTGHPRLSSHTPVRFDPDTIAAIRRFSDEDGVTVSAWVRHVVGREILRRISLRTRTASKRSNAVSFSIDQGAAPVTTTSAAASVKVLNLRPAS